MQKVKATAVGVLGMHRSGTSLVTRVVKLLGAYLGEEEELFLSKPDNPMGNCEHYAINAIHDRILETMGRTWDTALPLPNNWNYSNEITPFRDELIELIESRFANRPLWAWKDPRTSILLPLWREALGRLKIEPRFLLVYRNPLDVAQSLLTRDGISKDESFGLWLNHNLAMLRSSTGMRRALVSYQGLLTDPVESVTHWAPRISLPWSDKDKGLLDALRESVRVDLCHSASTLEELMQSGCPRPVVELAQLLHVMSNSGNLERSVEETKIRSLVETHVIFAGLYTHDFTRAAQVNSELRSELRTTSAILDQTRTQVQVREENLKQLQENAKDQERRLVEQFRAQLKSREENLTQALGTVKDQEMRLSEQLDIMRNATEHALYLEYRRTELQSHVALRAQQLEESQEALAEKEAALTELQAQMAQRAQQLEESQEALAEKEAALAEKETALVEKSNALTRSLWQRKATERQLAGLQASLDRIMSTYSWRLTSPLRGVMDALIAIRWKLYVSWYVLSHRDSLTRPSDVTTARHSFLDNSPVEEESTKPAIPTSTIVEHLEPDGKKYDTYQTFTKAGHDLVQADDEGALEPITGSSVLEFPASAVVGIGSNERPKVSVIIPAFNQANLTRECLNSLYFHIAGSPFEVVVVDDGSSDETPSLQKEMPWVRYIRREQNRGFGATCNLGATEARGEYLVFLNNDTTVCDGWMDALLETFEDWPRAGLVGSKLVYPDGTMQECGGLVFRDGSAANYGRGGDPQDPRYCFARETDYVSAAAMMIRADLFREIGGFDARYEPAYYEDTDLAFQVRERGLQVVINPHAVVRHHEGGTAGRDTSKGIKRYQVVNHKKFLERWQDVLSGYSLPPPGAPRPPKTAPRVLIVDWIVPRTDRDSGSVRMAGILRALRRLECHVTLVPRELRTQDGDEIPLEKIGVEILRSPHIQSVDRYLMEEGGTFDYVIVSRRETAIMHMDSVYRHCTNAKLVYDTCDLHFVREERESAIGRSDLDQSEIEKMKALELEFISRSDITLVVSTEEQETLRRIFPQHDVRILSNIVEPRPTTRPFGERSGIIFIGYFMHPPNIDGVLWFAREVLPELAHLGLKPAFHVVGSNPPPEVLKLESEQITIHGYVPDVEPLFNTCRLSVAPLRYGAGVKGKINQSLALGVPCVTTSIGAEGMFMENGVNGMVADEAIDFASAIGAAYQSEERWSQLREGGLETTKKYFSPEVAQAVLAELVFQRP